MDQNINTGLVLGLNYGSGSSSMLPLTMNHHRRREPSLRLERSSSNCVSLETSLTLGLSDGGHEPVAAGKHGDRRALRLLEPDGRQPSPDYSAMTSSFSDGRPARVKKESDETDSEEAEKGLSQISHELLEEGNGRKKLRLTKEQSALLEDKFKEQSTLNPRQKQILAKQLKLQPRQVEVWFQNRRARTKFKQTKVDCEVLRKCCEALRAENRRLQKELKALKLSRQLYMQPPSGAGNYTVCPSCESITAVAGDDAGAGRALAVASKPGFFKPFAHSAAC